MGEKNGCWVEWSTFECCVFGPQALFIPDDGVDWFINGEGVCEIGQSFFKAMLLRYTWQD